MKNIQKIIILLIFATFLNCGEDGTIGGVAFGTITGRVVEADNFEPIENAKITLTPTNNTVFTDSNGEFVFVNVPTNDYSVQAEKEDFLTKFEPITVETDATSNVVFELEISTAQNKPPLQPVLISPTNASDNLNNSVELTWSSSDPDNDPLNYKIEILNDNNNNVLEIENLTDTTYTLTNLRFGVKYFWQVAVSDAINPEVLSTVNSFTITSSPNNRFLYVKKSGNNNTIYSADLDANNIPVNQFNLTETASNSWRPRKNNTVNLISFLKIDDNQAHIFTMKPDGSDETKITASVPVNGFNLNELDFSWSNSGDKFIYPSFDKLYMINKDGSGLQLIHQTTNGNLISECDWSLDGTKIALKTNNSNGYNGEIYTINMNGAILDTVISNSIGALGGINFSANGNLLLYTKDISDFQSSDYRQLDTRIFIYDFTAMTNSDVSVQKINGTNDLDPRFSPNEAEIIFVNTSNDGISEKTIYKLEVNDIIERNILFENATMPDWE